MLDATFREIKFTDADVVNPDGFIPKGESNPHNVRPWLIHDGGFVVAIVFADCEQDAFDEAVDGDKLDSFQVKEDEISTDKDGTETVDGQSVTRLGNASEPFVIETMDIVEMPNPPFSFVALFNANRD